MCMLYLLVHVYIYNYSSRQMPMYMYFFMRMCIISYNMTLRPTMLVWKMILSWTN